MLIDTHCHLNFKAFRKNMDNVLWDAMQAGVKKIIVPGADFDTSRRSVELARSFKSIYAAVGIHPHHSKDQNDKVSQFKSDLKVLAQNNKVVAIGECGLDYYLYEKTKYKEYKVDSEFKQTQKNFFQMQLDLANELDLPVIIHNRNASQDIIKILNAKKTTGVFHCFEGDVKFLKWALSKKFYIGFDGNITYKKNLPDIVKKTPLANMILETDSPFLMPEPLRSQKVFPNKPENVKIIAGFIALAKGVPFAEVAKVTTLNARKLFKLS